MLKSVLVCFNPENVHTPQNRRDCKFLGEGTRVSKTNKLKEMYEFLLAFPEGWGGSSKNKTLPWRRYRYFMELHNSKKYVQVNVS